MGTQFFRFSVLIGPINHLKHLLSKDRLPFTGAYVTSLGLTLYFAPASATPGANLPVLTVSIVLRHSYDVLTKAENYSGSTVVSLKGKLSMIASFDPFQKVHSKRDRRCCHLESKHTVGLRR